MYLLTKFNRYLIKCNRDIDLLGKKQILRVWWINTSFTSHHDTAVFILSIYNIICNTITQHILYPYRIQILTTIGFSTLIYSSSLYHLEFPGSNQIFIYLIFTFSVFSHRIHMQIGKNLKTEFTLFDLA